MSERDLEDGHRFAEEAGRRPARPWRELVEFLRTNKKWWLTPILVVLLAIGALVVLSGTAAAPFIYPLF